MQAIWITIIKSYANMSAHMIHMFSQYNSA